MTKVIPILSGRCLVVEMSKQDFIKAKMQTLVDMRTVWSGKMNFKSEDGWESVSFPPGNWQVIGMLSEVTEKTLSTVLDSTELKEGRRLYNIHDEPYPNRLTDSALESLESAIKAEGYYLDENPYGEEPIRLPEGHNSHGTYESMWNQYSEAQTRVLSSGRCLLLIKR